MSEPDILVACLCAQWCGVCRDYAQAFAQLGERMAAARFVWVDVEDDADVVDPIEVDNFPTLLIAVGSEPRFFGVLTPQPQLLERMVQQCTGADGGDATLAARADLVALTQRVRAMH